MTYEKQKITVTAVIVVCAMIFFLAAFSVVRESSVACADGIDARLEIADELNSLLDEQASIAQRTPVPFAVPSEWQYGGDPRLATPRLKHGDNADVTFSIELNGIGIASELAVADISDYINKYMPVGDYVLSASIVSVTVAGEHEHWWDGSVGSDDAGRYDPRPLSYKFTVTDGDCSGVVADVISSLNGTRIEYVYDGEMHLLQASDVLAHFNGIYDRGADVENNYWKTEAADQYFDDNFIVEYNIAASGTAHYHTEEELSSGNADADCSEVLPIEGGKYKIYYRLRARNYLPTASDNEVNKTDAFYVYIIREVEVPSPVAEYTGERLTADVTDNAIYTVVSNDGGENAGEYDFTLELCNPDLYMWAGQELATRTAEITSKFTVAKASNNWIVLPDIVRWKEGEYNKSENTLSGRSRFGEVNIVILDGDDRVVYNRLADINLLASVPAGDYTLIAYVAETDNYFGIAGDAAYTKIVRVYPKEGMAWWGIMLIVLAVVCVIALFLFLLNEFGIVRLMSKKQATAMRVKANMDATIAAVRVARASRTNDGDSARSMPSGAAVADDNENEKIEISSESEDAEIGDITIADESLPDETETPSDAVSRDDVADSIEEIANDESLYDDTEMPPVAGSYDEVVEPIDESDCTLGSEKNNMPSADDLKEQLAAYAEFNVTHKFGAVSADDVGDAKPDEGENGNNGEDAVKDGGEYVPKDGAIFLDDDE